MSSWERVLKNFDKRLNHEEIDEFLEHLNVSVNRRIQRLEDEYNNLTVDQFEDPRDIDAYRYHLGETISSSYAAKALGDELSIIALYKKVESQTGRVVKQLIPAAAHKNLYVFKQLCEVLPFDIKTINGFASFNELRLLNNSIKHGEIVSQELADNFPIWKVGAEFVELDSAFTRILPGVEIYVSELVESVYALSKS
ncbi:MAG: hypothetical protein ABII63_07090 [Pseudomonadota bacterium]